MKRYLNRSILIFALVAAMILSIAALAEGSTETPEVPAIEETQPSEEQSAEDAALQEALDAYRATRQESKREALEAELNGYVASGKLTQEQADLILNYYQEHGSLHGGSKSKHGGAIQDNQGKNNVGKSSRENGSRGGNSYQHGGRQKSDDSSADTTSQGLRATPGSEFAEI
ncbi:MAG: hypothetical protein J5998_12700 [Clostridia bacterium]|nr:hypothetical protein [Clostridia bacterium]